MWNNSYISAVIEVFTMHWVMEPSITYGQLWLLIRYWPFWVAHFTNLTVNVSGAYWECQHSFISIGGNYRQVSWSRHDNPESLNARYLLFALMCADTARSLGAWWTLSARWCAARTTTATQSSRCTRSWWGWCYLWWCYWLLHNVKHTNRCMVQVYAECLLLKAMLTVCEDETLVSFVKAGLKVRQCYISFR